MKKSIKHIVIICLIVIIISLSALSLGACQKNNYIDATYTITYLSTSLLGDVNLAMFLDESLSYIKLNSDGTCTIRITPNEALIVIINLAIGGVEVPGGGLDSFSHQYMQEMFPGFSFNDMASGLALIEGSLGISLVGAESFSDALAAGDLSAIKVEEGFAIEVNSVYTIKQLLSENSGYYTAVYIGAYDDSYCQEPYTIFTMYEGDGISCLKTRFEIIGLDIDSRLIS